ncbi:MAG: thiamine pyrophosphate-binding protein [Bacteroidetes bacterium]|nr:thiamine pyrophosphate-binding protein [Bacteroidota bacterium]MCL5025709.1 thiamine pyrophosphate-binding protein [Chloroflexota bacterium]
MRVAEAIVKSLKVEGVKFVSGFPGAGAQPVINILYDYPEIRSILARHERVAVDIADGFARTTNTPGVAICGTGPGAGQAFTGISQSFSDCVPVLLLQGQAPLHGLGTQYTQEIDAIDAFRTITKWEIQLNVKERASEVVRRAFTLMRSGRKGPVMIEMPNDVVSGEIADENAAYRPVGPGLRSAGDPREIDKAAALLLAARSPVLYAGAGVLWADAWDELRTLAEMLTVPVMTTLNGKSCFPEDHPLALGMGGYPKGRLATSQANHFARKADLVLAIGNSFKPMATGERPIPPDVKLIHIDAEQKELNKVYQADVGIMGDAKLALQQLIEAVKSRATADRLAPKPEIPAEIKQLKEQWLAHWMPKLTSNAVPVNPYRITWEIQHNVDRNKTIVLHDSGYARGHVSHIYESLVPRGYLGMGGQSEMGWSLGAAIGAKLGRPDFTVINVMGDGAFGMTGMDMETAVRNEVPIITVIPNNSNLGITRGGIPEGKYNMVELSGNYAKVAEGLGAYSERVEDPNEVGPAIKRAIRANAEGQPALIEVIAALEPTPSMP